MSGQKLLAGKRSLGCPRFLGIMTPWRLVTFISLFINITSRAFLDCNCNFVETNLHGVAVISYEVKNKLWVTFLLLKLTENPFLTENPLVLLPARKLY